MSFIRTLIIISAVVFHQGTTALASNSSTASTTVSAPLEQQICEGWVTARAQNKTVSVGKVLGLVFRISYAKKTVLSAHAVGPEPSETESAWNYRFSNSQGAVYSVAMSDFEFNETEYLQNQKKWNQIKNRLGRIIQNTTSVEACTSAIQVATQKSTIDLNEYLQLTQYLISNYRVSLEIGNRKLDHIVAKSLRFYPGLRHVKQVKNNGLSGLMSGLENQAESLAVLVLHSTQDGKLYDSNWNEIPYSFFQKNRLSKNIRTLAIFSCHPDAVRKHYGLDALTTEKNIQVIYPTIGKKVEWLYKQNGTESVPIALFGLFLKQVLNQAEKNPQKNSQTLVVPKNCSLTIEADSLVSGELGVMLNQNYIGSISPEQKTIIFDCSVLKEKNTVQLQAMNLFIKPVVLPGNYCWQARLNATQFEITNFFQLVNGTQYVGSRNEIPVNL